MHFPRVEAVSGWVLRRVTFRFPQVVSGCAELLKDLKTLPDELKSAVRPPRAAARRGSGAENAVGFPQIPHDFNTFNALNPLNPLNALNPFNTRNTFNTL